MIFPNHDYRGVISSNGNAQENGEKELSSMFDNALSLSVQLDAYPKAKIDVRVTIIEDDGGADMAALTWCVAL
jgi:ribonuclease PH